MQYHLPETNSTGRVSDITANDLCCQPNSCLQQDLADKIIKIEAATNGTIFQFSLVHTLSPCAFYFSFHNLSHLSKLFPYTDSMTRHVGSFKIPFP